MSELHARLLMPFLATAMERVSQRRVGRCTCGDCTISAIELEAWRMYWAMDGCECWTPDNHAGFCPAGV